MDRDEAKEYIIANPEIYFKRAKRSGYICPLCQNGTGRNGTGIEETPKSKGLFKCFKCDFSGDVLHFIAKENNLDIKSDFPKVMDIACSIYGITGDYSNSKKKEYKMKRPMDKKDNKLSGVAQEAASVLAETDYSDFFKEAAKHIHETDYLTKRGISEAVQKEFNIGYCKEWKHPEKPKMMPSERIIIPTSKHSYMARATNENKEQPKAMKVGKSHIFNSEVLSAESSEPIFVCEGEIDALSIIEAGGQAVGLGGVSGVGLFINELEKRKNEGKPILRPLLICLDKDGAGKKAATDLKKELDTKGYFYIDVCEKLLFAKENEDKNKNEYYKDPNDALRGGKEGFKKNVETAMTTLTKEKIDEEKENYIQEYRDKVASVLTSFYLPKRTVATGFETLDDMLDDGLHAGLYIMAAASGAGKTTFALQVADNIARAGQDVLFFSGEMTMPEIMAKSLSRLSKETSKGNDRNALTMRTILNIASCNNSDYQQRLKELITENYCGIVEHMRIYDGLQEIDDIKTKIEEHKRRIGNNPVIFIDYLQITKNKETTLSEKRLQVDEIVSQLRIAAVQQYETPIFVISSLNRTAYGRGKTGSTPESSSDEKDIYMADLKESGGIEYRADVIITLQAEKETDEDSGDKDGVRPMKLRVIKNRTGQRHNKRKYISLDFYTRFNYFEDKKVGKDKKGNRAQIAGSDPKKIV
jgi:replicative DNA helicase